MAATSATARMRDSVRAPVTSRATQRPAPATAASRVARTAASATPATTSNAPASRTSLRFTYSSCYGTPPCHHLVRMRVIVAVLSLSCILVGIAAADNGPLKFRMKSQVPQGEKPVLELTGVVAVSDLRIELARNDGKKFSLRQPA